MKIETETEISCVYQFGTIDLNISFYQLEKLSC
jgi:hypothetical protein